MPAASEVTQILAAMSEGDRSGVDRLWALVKDELHKVAESYFRRESSGHTLQPTALVNEVYIRMADHARVQWKGRAHFMTVAAMIMRRILVDHARARRASKRGGAAPRIELHGDVALSADRTEDVLAIDEALAKLAALDARQAQIVELRFFAGLSVPEVAESLGVSPRLVEAEWTMIRAWLKRELTR